ncbi:MAG: hypothetical protein RMN24_05925 [Anaerolineae bacterium]|nr:hypothetical protein [Caldilineales bacterium]MCX7851631.1 hypothetical protein [Caldilineales bacterium]MDW8268690.1 hypothetical protein [Anaerolineae bacterium]
MKALFKLVAGLGVGAALGVGVYWLVTSDREQGLLAELKELVSQVVEEGKAAAAQRRRELELELGQKDV